MTGVQTCALPIWPVLPLVFFPTTIAPTGAVFCVKCGLPGSSGDLFFGANNTGQIRRVVLAEDRRHIASMNVVYTAPKGIVSMERGPNGHLYFSDSRAIYELIAA